MDQVDKSSASTPRRGSLTQNFRGAFGNRRQPTPSTTSTPARNTQPPELSTDVWNASQRRTLRPPRNVRPRTPAETGAHEERSAPSEPPRRHLLSRQLSSPNSHRQLPPHRRPRQPIAIHCPSQTANRGDLLSRPIRRTLPETSGRLRSGRLIRHTLPEMSPHPWLTSRARPAPPRRKLRSLRQAPPTSSLFRRRDPRPKHAASLPVPRDHQTGSAPVLLLRGRRTTPTVR